MRFGLIDSHAHLTCETLYPDLSHILKKAQEAQISHIINICTDELSLERGLNLINDYPWIYHTAATTPHDVEKSGEVFFPFVVQAVQKGQLKAIGETGLDYFYEHSPRVLQKKSLVRYLHLALTSQLPVVIHCREAFTDLFEIIDSEYQVQGKIAPGILHCFTGTLKEALKVIERGWMLSLSGITTFKKSSLQEIAREIPLSHLLIETDSPYLAPQSKRGQRNEPAFLLETAQCIALQKQIDVQEVIYQTTENTKKIFNL